MIFLKKSLMDSLDTVSGIQAALQTAIELEHATIPVYLYSYYSLLPAKNLPIRTTLSSVAKEEMLHFALACNLLNAIGGAPIIDSPDFVPSFPGLLPGSINGGLQVSLQPFSVQHVKDVFMEIEEPEKPLEFNILSLGVQPPATIGQFYSSIRSLLEAEASTIFSGDPLKQLSGDVGLGENIIAVTDLQSAKDAIDLIVEQGEGTTQSPLSADSQTQLAHYYKFSQIFHGKQLVPTLNPAPGTPPDQLFSYSGKEITLDETGVLSLIHNPKISSYKDNSPEKSLATDFAKAYTGMLKILHNTFNGHPDEFSSSIPKMFELTAIASKLCKIEVSPGINAGPCFEYIP